MITMLENNKYVHFHERTRLRRLRYNSFIHASYVFMLANAMFTKLGFSQRESAILLFGTESSRVFPLVVWEGKPSYTAYVDGLKHVNCKMNYVKLAGTF